MAHDAESLAAKLSGQDQAFLNALSEVQRVKDFVGDPAHILGRENTKHGEIAEELHVAVRRAWDVLHQRDPTANISDVPRTGSVDYVDNGIEIQSKFYNGLRNTLGGVSDHADKYAEWAADSGRYHIPSDQFEQLSQLGNDGTIDGLSTRTVRGVQRQVESLQQDTGRSIEELIEPGEARYDEVTRGRIHETIENRESRIENRNEELKDHFRSEHAPLEAAATASALGAGAGAGVRFAQAVWAKMRKGKNPFRGDFSIEDWKDVGLDSVKGAAGGAVAGGTVYLLTNATDLAAPFAGSLVSGLVGIGNLLGQYHAGTINHAEFVDLSLMVAAESAIVGLSAAAGQILIPVPMLGAVIGALAGKIVLSSIKAGLAESESALIEMLKSYETRAIAKLDDALRVTMEKLDAYYGRLADFARIAFDEGINTDLRLAASIRIAETVGVPDSEILRSRAEIDTFMQE